MCHFDCICHGQFIWILYQRKMFRIEKIVHTVSIFLCVTRRNIFACFHPIKSNAWRRRMHVLFSFQFIFSTVWNWFNNSLLHTQAHNKINGDDLYKRIQLSQGKYLLYASIAKQTHCLDTTATTTKKQKTVWIHWIDFCWVKNKIYAFPDNRPL